MRSSGASWSSSGHPSECPSPADTKARDDGVGPGPWGTSRDAWLDRLDVLRLQALRSAAHVERHLLSLGEGAKPLRVDGGVMDEDVLASAVLGDEAKALRIVEPLHGTGSHASRFAVLAVGRKRRAVSSPLGRRTAKNCAQAQTRSQARTTCGARRRRLTRRAVGGRAGACVKHLRAPSSLPAAEVSNTSKRRAARELPSR